MANFPGAAQAGFQSAMQTGGRPNAFGGFVKLMLADWEQKKQLRLKYGYDVALEQAKQKTEQESPLYQAQTKAYQALGTQRTEGLIDEEIKKEAWDKYKAGDRSPEVLKTLGKWVSPMEAAIAQGLGFTDGDNVGIGTTVPVQTSRIPPKPKYDPKTQKLLFSKSLNQYKVVNK